MFSTSLVNDLLQNNDGFERPGVSLFMSFVNGIFGLELQ